MSEVSEILDWRAALGARRKHLGLSRRELGERCELSSSTIKSVETGTRHPSLETLNRLIDGLGLTRDEANPVRTGAGYAVDWESLFHHRFRAEPGWLAEAVEECPWPVLVTGQGFNVVHGNKVLQKIWEIDLAREYTDPGERNFLAQASTERFVKYVDNFDELLSFMLGLAKGDPRMQQSLESPAPWLQDAMRRFMEGEPQYVARLMAAWEGAEPLPHRTRFHYRVRWLYRGEKRMRFFGMTTIADIWNELSWNDWVPEDAETWLVLNQIVAGE